MKTYFYILFFTIPIFLTNCNTSEKQTIKINKDSIFHIEKSIVYEKYEIPLPVEIFKFVEEDTALNTLNLAKMTKKKSSSSQNNALLLGIYSADLAFSSFCEQGQTTLDYSDVCKAFAKDLNIDDAFDQSYLERLKNNINQQDSLMIITNEVYNKTCKVMESNGMHNVIPFVVFSGWIESLYLALNYSGNNYTKIDSVINQCRLENLISYMYDVQVETNAYFYNDDLKNIILEITEIQKEIKKYREDYQTYPDLKTKISNRRNSILNCTLL